MPKISGERGASLNASVIPLILLFLVSLLNFLDRHMLAVLLPAIKHDLRLTDTELGFMASTAFSLFYAAMGIPIGRMADRYPARTIIAGSLALWSVMTAACGLAQNFLQLVLARVLVGVGEAGATPAANVLIAKIVAPAQRARAIAVFAMGLPAGLFVGFLGGGLVSQALGWRMSLLVFGAPGILLAVVIWLLLPKQQEQTSFVDAPTTLKSAFAAIASSRTLVCVCVGSGLFTLAWQGMIAWLPSYFTRTHGWTIANAGAELALMLAASQALGLFAGGVGGDILARRGARWHLWICVGASLISLPFFVLGFAAADSGISVLAMFAGFTIGLLQGAPALAAVHSVTPVSARGVAVATYLTAVNLTAGFGALLIGALNDGMSANVGDGALGNAILFVVAPACLSSALAFALGTRTVDLEATNASGHPS